MTETLLGLVADYGVWVLAALTFLSCLMVPVPSSLGMLAAGGFIASGDLQALPTVSAALAGAVAGDHLGFLAGRRLGVPLLDRMRRTPKRAAMIDRVTTRLRSGGGLLVYLSRWLVSPLGPYVNIAGGALGLPLRSFTPADLAGEATWVAIYVGLGYAFADDIVALASLLGNLSGFLAAAAVAVGAALWLALSPKPSQPR